MIPSIANHSAISNAVELLRNGDLVAFPTETVYGLGADASNPNAVKKIFQVKGRPSTHPVIVHIHNIGQLDDWASEIPNFAQQLAKTFWPGPLTLILNKSPKVPDVVTGGQHTIALRIPGHKVALQLLAEFGQGIAAPSANRFGRISPTQAQHVVEELGDDVQMVLDGGACQLGLESTILDLTSATPTILRPGKISRGEIEAVLQTEILTSSRSKTRAPGMLVSHYAPSTPARMYARDDLIREQQSLIHAGHRAGLLTHSDIPVYGSVINIKLEQLSSLYARHLYAALRELDQHDLDVILIEKPPIEESWQAVNDRLLKATSSS